MSLTYENPVAWRRAGQVLTGTLAITLALGATAMIPVNGGPVTQATTPDSNTSPPNTIIISSPAVTDVVKMVDAKVDPSVIKAFIQNSTTTFNPSASDLIALKNHGVPDEILTAMLERGAQVRSQIAQSLQKPAAAAPTYAAPTTAPTMAPEATYASYPSDYSSYGAPYADYSYGYPYAYSYPYNYWWYGYPYYSFSSFWPYCGYYGRYYCGRYGYCYPGSWHGNGHWNGNHPNPHSNGTFVNHWGSGRPGAFAPVGSQSRPANFAMNRSPSVPVSSGAHQASFARAGGFRPSGGFSAGHTGGGARVGGGGGHVSGGGHR
jgi:hypothetical protein